MDLIYADSSGDDIGVLDDYSLDLAYGSDENSFEVIVDISNNVCEHNCYIYIDNTEYGGIIDTMTVNTDDDTITYSGRSWHGILASKVLQPNSGQDYYTVSGSASSIITNIINRVSLGDLFIVGNITDFNVSNYRFNRYVNVYDALTKFLSDNGRKLKLNYSNKKVQISAPALVDYSQDEEWDSDELQLEVTKSTNFVNHVICLGKGELSARAVIHMYQDVNGNISTRQSLTGMDEFMKVVDYPNAEDTQELTDKATKELKEAYAGSNRIEADFDSINEYDIGDIVGAYERVTGIFVAREITKKIVKVSEGKVNVTCQIGE